MSTVVLNTYGGNDFYTGGCLVTPLNPVGRNAIVIITRELRSFCSFLFGATAPLPCSSLMALSSQRLIFSVEFGRLLTDLLYGDFHEPYSPVHCDYKLCEMSHGLYREKRPQGGSREERRIRRFEGVNRRELN